MLTYSPAPQRSISPCARNISTSKTPTIQTIIRKCPWHWLALRFMSQVGSKTRSGSRLLMSVTAEAEPCDYFRAKVQINPMWVTTSLIWTKCAVLCDLCWKTYGAEWLNVSDNRCFFSSVAVVLSSSQQNIPTVTPGLLTGPALSTHTFVYTSFVRESSGRFLDKYTNLCSSQTFEGSFKMCLDKCASHRSLYICKC